MAKSQENPEAAEAVAQPDGQYGAPLGDAADADPGDVDAAGPDPEDDDSGELAPEDAPESVLESEEESAPAAVPGAPTGWWQAARRILRLAGQQVPQDGDGGGAQESEEEPGAGHLSSARAEPLPAGDEEEEFLLVVSSEGDGNGTLLAEGGSLESVEPITEVAPVEDPLLVGLSGLAPENAGPGAAAFFDVDNTTMRGSSFVALAKGMADRDYFTTAEILAITWKQLKYVVSGKENMADITQATENGLEFVKGREVSEIQRLSDEVYDEKMVKRLWAGTLALTEAHLAAGHQVWLVSATPAEVAEVIAARLGLTGGLGTVAEVVDGRYTGKLQGLPLHGSAKADVISALAELHGLDLARCSAYSDSANDIPMLSIVGHPVAINPDGRLRAHAKENGWPIRDYRIRGKESVRKGVPAAAAAGLIAGAAVGVAKGIGAMRGDQR